MGLRTGLLIYAALSRLVIIVGAALMASPVWAGAALVAGPVDFGRYHALVIGNEDYRYVTGLNTAIDDAEAVARLLEDRYGFQVTLLRDATRDDILEALNRLRRDLTERDNLLIYYAGHGVLDETTNTGYWQPVDARPGSDTRWIPTTDISRQLTRMNAKHVMVIADSCYAGALLTRDGGEQLRSGEELGTWIRRMAEKGARTALTSGGLEPVLDSGGGNHWVFAGVLLEVLRDNDEILDGDGLFDRIKLPVVRKARQTPRYADIRSPKHDGGDFLLVPKAVQGRWGGRGEPLHRPDEVYRAGAGTEAVFWGSIKNSANPAYFEEYLRRFPEGVFSGLARLRLEELSDTREDSDTIDAPTQPSVEATHGDVPIELSRSQWQEVQKALNDIGFDAGAADGIPGPKTDSAIALFQESRGLPPSGQLTEAQRARLLSDAQEAAHGRLEP